MDKKWYLKKINIFHDLSDDDKKLFFKYTIKKQYEKGDIIFNFGEPGDKVFIIESGRVKICDYSETGKETIFWFREEGEIFGLAEVVCQTNRSCYAEAIEPSCIYILKQENLTKLLNLNFNINMLIIKILCCRLRQLGERIKSLSLYDLKNRLAQVLIDISHLYGKEENGKIKIIKKITHQDLSNIVGASRQRVTETLNYFIENNLIEYNAKKFIIITNLNKLIKIACI